jgi:hypothetical protein
MEAKAKEREEVKRERRRGRRKEKRKWVGRWERREREKERSTSRGGRRSRDITPPKQQLLFLCFQSQTSMDGQAWAVETGHEQGRDNKKRENEKGQKRCIGKPTNLVFFCLWLSHPFFLPPLSRKGFQSA